MVSNSKKDKHFISSLSYSQEEVQKILFEKIQEENEFLRKNITSLDQDEEKKMLKSLDYKVGKINIVSLFSGAGGLDLGVELSGMVVSNNEDYAYNILKNKDEYLTNRKKSITNFIYSNDLFESANLTYIDNFSKSVTKISKDIRKIYKFPTCDLMLGGFPCPGFSAAGPRLLDDPRNFLYIHYIRALMQSKPKFFIAENVKGLMTMGNGQVLSQMIEDFKAANYDVSAHLVNARDYGVAQNRERVFIIGVRKDIEDKYDFKYQLPKKTHGTLEVPYLTLRDVIGDLPKEAEDVYDATYSSMYMSRNRKKNWNDQSFTIQASGRQAPQHPGGEPMEHIGKDLWTFRGDFNRRLSVKECARIQSFPDWFEFSDGNKITASNNHRLNEKYKQIGNAVPVILAEKMSRPIIEFLNKHSELL